MLRWYVPFLYTHTFSPPQLHHNQHSKPQEKPSNLTSSDDPACACQPAPPKPNRQIQLILHDPNSRKTIAIHHADADLDIAFDIINKRLVLQETIYRVLPVTPSPTSGGGGGKEISTSRTPLPKRPISWTFTMNFPISTSVSTKSKNGAKNGKSKSKSCSNSNSSGGTALHFQNLIGLNDNSLLLTLTLQTTPSPSFPLTLSSAATGGEETGRRERERIPNIHTKHRINNFNTTLEKSLLQENLHIPLLRAQQKTKVQMQIFLPAERLHSWRTVALIVRTFRRVSAEQWCRLIHLKSVPCRPPGVGGLDWRGLEEFVLDSAASSASASSLSGSGDGEGKWEYTTKKKKKEPNKKNKKRDKMLEKKKIPWGEKKNEERLPEDVDDPVIGVGDYIIFRELYTW